MFCYYITVLCKFQYLIVHITYIDIFLFIHHNFLSIIILGDLYMRLWHKNLICVLPKNQLIGQVREISAITKDIKSMGTTNHILINKIMNYPLSHLYTYCKLIEKEMLNRNFKLSIITKERWYSTFENNEKNIIPINELFINWHNDIYLKICYYNLLEKFLCGGIPKNEFKKIENIYYSMFSI